MKRPNAVYFIFFFKILCLVQHFFLVLFFPNTSPIRAMKLSKLAKRIVVENRIELVVCTFCPYENIYTGIKLKQKLGNSIRVVSYHLDLRTESQNASKYVRNFVYTHALRSIIKENKTVDKILVPYSGRDAIVKLQGIDLAKIEFVGLPVYLKGNNVVNEKCLLLFSNDVINICYIGSLHHANRTPRYILELLEQVSKGSEKN